MQLKVVFLRFGGREMAILTRLGKVLTSEIIRDTRHKKNEQAKEEKDLLHFMKQRRTFKKLGKRVIFNRPYLNNLIKESVRCCPSALNSQSVRVVILTDDAHFKFWHMVKEVQKQNLPAHIAESAIMKIDGCSDAFGTVLFFEDNDVISALQKQKPLQASEFALWSEQTSGMAQFAVWTALTSIGLGAALQHYNPLINEETTKMFDLPESWDFKAQLVFGSVQAAAKEKSVEDDETMFKYFNAI